MNLEETDGSIALLRFNMAAMAAFLFSGVEESDKAASSCLALEDPETLGLEDLGNPSIKLRNRINVREREDSVGLK